MGTEVRIRPARAADGAELVRRMRAADAREVERSGAAESLGAVVEGALQCSDVALAVDLGGALAALVGTVPVSLLSHDRVVWALTTETVAQYPLSAARVSRALLARFRASCAGRLGNLVDAEHAVAVRWLQWLGARFAPAAVLPSGAAFVPFFWDHEESHEEVGSV